MAITNIASAGAPASFGKWIESLRPLGEAKAGAINPSEVPGLAGAGAKPASFSNLLDSAVSEVNSKMNAAQIEQGKLITGETNNIHQAMIAVQEAGVAFSLMVEVRNKLVESYQELMRMQV